MQEAGGVAVKPVDALLGDPRATRATIRERFLPSGRYYLFSNLFIIRFAQFTNKHCLDKDNDNLGNLWTVIVCVSSKSVGKIRIVQIG